MASPNSSWRAELKTQASTLGTIVAILWVVQVINDSLFQGHLSFYGIAPRQLSGLQGIFLAPWLHGSYGHLLANTVPFVTLGWLIMLRETLDFVWVSLIAMVVSGAGTWLIGAPGSVHVGASGVVFGYLGYLLARGWFERSGGAIALSMVAFFLYGGLIWGVLPIQQGVSWEGHLFGFIGGILAARWLAQRPTPPRQF